MKTAEQIKHEVARQIIARLHKQHGEGKLAKRAQEKRDEAAVELACGAWMAAIAISGEDSPEAKAIAFLPFMASVRGYDELKQIAERGAAAAAQELAAKKDQLARWEHHVANPTPDMPTLREGAIEDLRAEIERDEAALAQHQD